jgi:hypothetical protein
MLLAISGEFHISEPQASHSAPQLQLQPPHGMQLLHV